MMLVTIRLKSFEMLVDPDLQQVRTTKLDGRGAPMGQVETISLQSALSILEEVSATRSEAPQ